MGCAILDQLLAALEDVFRVHGLDEEELPKARAFAIDSQFRNTFTGKEMAVSPDGSRVAYVVAKQGIEATNVHVQLDSRGRGKGPIASLHFAADSPDEFVFRMHFGKLTWINNQKIRLSRMGKQDITLDLP
jgi:hypothetical protein